MKNTPEQSLYCGWQPWHWESVRTVLPGLYLGLILVAALGLRVAYIEHETLWTDEVFPATFAVQPIFELFIANLRFDAHPPLYHLQLHLWALISQSTDWLYLNSVAWSWVAVVV